VKQTYVSITDFNYQLLWPARQLYKAWPKTTQYKITSYYNHTELNSTQNIQIVAIFSRKKTTKMCNHDGLAVRSLRKLLPKLGEIFPEITGLAIMGRVTQDSHTRQCCLKLGKYCPGVVPL